MPTSAERGVTEFVPAGFYRIAARGCRLPQHGEFECPSGASRATIPQLGRGVRQGAVGRFRRSLRPACHQHPPSGLGMPPAGASPHAKTRDPLGAVTDQLRQAAGCRAGMRMALDTGAAVDSGFGDLIAHWDRIGLSSKAHAIAFTSLDGADRARARRSDRVAIDCARLEPASRPGMPLTIRFAHQRHQRRAGHPVSHGPDR